MNDQTAELRLSAPTLPLVFTWQGTSWALDPDHPITTSNLQAMPIMTVRILKAYLEENLRFVDAELLDRQGLVYGGGENGNYSGTTVEPSHY